MISLLFGHVNKKGLVITATSFVIVTTGKSGNSVLIFSCEKARSIGNNTTIYCARVQW